jgi:hypothetical protein
VPVDQGVGQVPMSITTSVDASNVASPQDANKPATEIIRQNQPVINRFVSIQRQQIEIGGLDIHSSILPLKDMSVYYSYVQGREKMHYHIAPQVEAAPEIPQPEALPEEAPKPPTPEEPPEVSRPPDLEARVPTPEGSPAEPEVELPPEERPPEEEKPPKEEELPEEEKKEKKEAPEFLEIDMPCFLPVEFGDGAGDP